MLARGRWAVGLMVVVVAAASMAVLSKDVIAASAGAMPSTGAVVADMRPMVSDAGVASPNAGGMSFDANLVSCAGVAGVSVVFVCWALVSDVVA